MDRISLTDIKDLLELHIKDSKVEIWFQIESGDELLLVFALTKNGRRITKIWTVEQIKLFAGDFERLMVTSMISDFNEAPMIIL